MEVASITSKASGKELRKRDVQVVDDTNREVSFALMILHFYHFDNGINLDKIDNLVMIKNY